MIKFSDLIPARILSFLRKQEATFADRRAVDYHFRWNDRKKFDDQGNLNQSCSLAETPVSGMPNGKFGTPEHS
ncbi:MAG: hypothetical protein DRI57_19265 [Deltaproteobacteria bacterium]|nr:MAG: hypothetical protein DRI57_19265 [Deltaproteobacteria bacterium]